MPISELHNLTSSGLNSHFSGEGLSFDNYVDLMRDIIIKSRKDLNDDEQAGKIIVANSPFSWQPKKQRKPRNGILLIHGLFDSPYYVRDLGSYFHSKDFLVNAILLPGHGTVAGDLLNVNYEEWVKAVQYGITSLASQVDNVYLAGYSLGGLLALNAVLDNHHSIKGLILVAPALKPKRPWKVFLAKYHHFFSWLGARLQWFQIKKISNFAKYGSYPFNAGLQAHKLMTLVDSKLQQQNVTTPLFVVISKDDETISYQGILSFFMKQSHPDSRLLIYSNDHDDIHDNRVIVRPSLYPKLKIINFSHSCLTISPQNPLLGAESRYYDIYHYRDCRKIDLASCYLGATTKENLKKCVISRLSYNPDFDAMLELVDSFINTTLT